MLFGGQVYDIQMLGKILGFLGYRVSGLTLYLLEVYCETKHWQRLILVIASRITITLTEFMRSKNITKWNIDNKMEHRQSMIKDTEKPGNGKKRTIPFNTYVGYQFS